MQLQSPAVFETADYGVAGYLMATGFEPATARQQGRQVLFAFDSSTALVAAVGDYTSNKPVPCRDYFHGLRKAKSIIREIIHTYVRLNSTN